MRLNTFPKWFAFFIILLTAVSYFLSGCKTVEKTVDREKEIRDSLAVVDAESRLAEMTKQRNHFESKLRESEYLQANFKECPPVINADSLRIALTSSGCDSSDIASLRDELRRTKSRYQRLADGSVVIEGNLQSVTELNTKQQDSIRDISSEKIKLAEELKRTQTEFSAFKESVKKEVVKKPATFWYWVLFFAGMIAGAFLWDNLGAKVKAKFSSIKLFKS